MRGGKLMFNTQLIMPLYDQDWRQFLRPNGLKADVVAVFALFVGSITVFGHETCVAPRSQPAHILV